MGTTLVYLGVFVAAAVPWLEVLFVVPAGVLAGLPAAPVTLVAVAGNASTLLPLVWAGDRVRSWWRRRHGADDTDGPESAAGRTRGSRARRVLDRYGLPGLAALGPLVTGIHVAAVVALAAGADRRRTSIWLTGGMAIWAVIAALATVWGLDAFVSPESLPDWFGP